MRVTEPETDPTGLTTKALLREIELLREWIKTKFDGVESRFLSMDKALELLQKFADKSPTTAAVDQAVKELEKLVGAKFGRQDDLDALREEFAKQLNAERSRFTDQITNIKETCDHKIADINQKQVDNTWNMRASQFNDVGIRLTKLEEWYRESVGKTSVADPAMATTLKDMGETLRTIRGSTDAGRNQVIAWVIAGASVLMAAFVFSYNVFK